MAVPLFVLVNERRKVYRRRKGLEHLTDADIQKHTGFPPWGVREIIEVFEPCSGQTKASIPIETRVLCYLSHLRSGSFQWCLGSMTGISQPNVSRIIDQCLNFTLGLAPTVIKFPDSLADFNNVKQEFYNSSRFPNVLGIIDGSQIPILAPREDEAIYVCRKQYHSINAQVICGPNYRFFDVVAKWPGSTHDSFIYNNSTARRRINSGEFGDGWFLGK
jgi:hypothetical protein